MKIKMMKKAKICIPLVFFYDYLLEIFFSPLSKPSFNNNYCYDYGLTHLWASFFSLSMIYLQGSHELLQCEREKALD